MFFVQLLKIKRQTTSYPVWELRPRELLRMWVCYLLLLRDIYIYIYTKATIFCWVYSTVPTCRPEWHIISHDPLFPRQSTSAAKLGTVLHVSSSSSSFQTGSSRSTTIGVWNFLPPLCGQLVAMMAALTMHVSFLLHLPPSSS